MKVNLLLTGNELMAGDTIDSNSVMMAEQLAPLGWRIHKKVTVGDDRALLRAEIDQLCDDADVLIINGGLGPTVDDLTAQVLAECSGQPLQEHPAAIAHLEDWCQRRGFAMNASNRKQAMLPAHCDIIANARGSAVGIMLQHRSCLVLATPGVPSELRQMLTDEILPLLRQRFDSDHIRTLRLGVFGLGESGIQEQFNRELADWPADIELGFRASMPVLEVKLTARGQDACKQIATWRQPVEALLGDHLLGELPLNLPALLVKELQRAKRRLCTAESCTGGLIAAQITSVAGASAVFPGGVVSYSNAMKQSLLGVDQGILERCGAVSEEVAVAMARGALRISGADMALAVTGIAGPDGGSDDKPVGTVWLAWGDAEQLRSLCLHLPFDRQGFQQWVAALGIDLLRRQLLGVDTLPGVVQRYRRS
ncbi:CinA family nicotinamide mononucleotide deamidase-related protein [Spongiibacter sp.]|uniref:CinA family nicotinamide mononucleotide deamidase-related protein n=1 Tax=Spongiibacter sp. TaxID=2024860 RepID=UPI003561B027